MPRMIWGLEGEDAASNRSRTDGHQSGATSHSSHRSVANATQGPVPPRFQKTKTQGDRGSATQIQDQEQVKPGNRLEVPYRQQNQSSSIYLHGQIIKDPSDDQHEPDTPESDYPDYDFSSLKVQRPPSHDLHLYDLVHSTGIDWRAVLLAQQKLGNSSILSPSTSSLASVGDPDGRLKLFTPGSLHSWDSRSPIILENGDPVSQLSETRSNAPRRMSALEIAQKYRLQQLQQQYQQSLLPTPPSSSSPLWSSGFSPYQDSLVSPELLAAACIPRNVSNSLLVQTGVPPAHGSSKHLRSSAYAGTGSMSRHVDLPTLTQSTQLEAVPSSSKQISPMIAEAGLTHSIADYIWKHPRKSPTVAPSVQQVERSPTLPRQPPNTPLSSLSNILGTQLHQLEPDADVAEHEDRPLSPTSPKAHLRSISQQHPRSIPLARLIQRRLSSVPEEEAAFVGGDRDHLSSSSRMSESGHCYPLPRVRSYSSEPTPSQTFNDRFNDGHQYQAPPPVASHHRTSGAGANHSQRHAAKSEHVSAQAMVRLPGGGGASARARDESGGGRDERGGERERSGSGASVPAPGTARERGNMGRGGRGRGRGARGRNRREGASVSGLAGVRNGLERVEGGMVVKS